MHNTINCRILWACVFFLAFGNATHLAVKAYIHYKAFPITFELNSFEIPISWIPFPTINISTFNSLKTTIVEQAIK
jgi:hypothetical protein